MHSLKSNSLLISARRINLVELVQGKGKIIENEEITLKQTVSIGMLSAANNRGPKSYAWNNMGGVQVGTDLEALWWHQKIWI